MEVLTHSKRQSFETCRRHYLHRHLQHLTLRSQRQGRRRGTIFGDAIYDVTVAHKVGAFEDDKHTPADVVRQSIEKAYDEIITGSNLDAAGVNTMEVEAVKVEVMVNAYIERYGMDFRREIQFDLPLINPRTGKSSRAFTRGGKIDGTLIIGEKKVLIVEDKFVGNIQKAMIERLPLDAQSSEYVDAFLQKGWDAHVAYRHTRVPGKNPLPAKALKTKDDRPAESLDEFYDRLAEDVAENPDSYFDEQILIFPKKHLDDYRRGRWGVAQDILVARRQVGTARQDETFYMNASRCWEYGGCEFIPLCTKRDGAMDLYVIDDDNPELNKEGIDSEYVSQT